MTNSQPPSRPVLDEQRQLLARHYGRQRRLLAGGEAALALAYLVAWQAGLTSTQVHLFGPAAVIVMFAVLAAGFDLVSLPLAWAGYRLSRSFGLSTQSVRSWLVDNLKGLLLSLVLGGAVVELTYLFMGLQPGWWWLIMAGFLLLFTVLLANLAPALIAPLFYRFTPLQDADLTERLLRLARKAGTHVKGVFTMHLSDKTTAANAALMGWGNTRRIVVGDTLTSQFTADETEAVLAHELGHQVHHDIWRSIALQTLTTLIALWLVSVSLGWVIGAGLAPGLPDAANMPALAVLFGCWNALFMPLTNWASRVAERRADEYAVEMATVPAAFADSMIRLANQNLSDVDPPRWVEIALYDHPAIKRRIALVNGRRGDAAGATRPGG